VFVSICCEEWVTGWVKWVTVLLMGLGAGVGMMGFWVECKEGVYGGKSIL